MIFGEQTCIFWETHATCLCARLARGATAHSSPQQGGSFTSVAVECSVLTGSKLFCDRWLRISVDLCTGSISALLQVDDLHRRLKQLGGARKLRENRSDVDVQTFSISVE